MTASPTTTPPSTGPRTSQSLGGIIVPIITPFDPRGGVDFKALAAHAERLITAGIHGLFVLGTTGEFHGLDLGQRREVVACVLEAARGRVPVVAGIAGDSTQQARATLAACQDPRLAGYVASAPYFMDHDQMELASHFRALAQAAGRSLIIYNFVARYRNHIAPATVEALVADGTTDAIKDSDRDRGYITALFGIRARHPGFRVYPSHLEHLAWSSAQGIEGSVQAIANLMPAAYARCWRLILARDTAGVEAEVARLWAINQAIDRAGPFISVLKGAIAARGWCGPATVAPTRVSDPASCAEIVRMVEAIEAGPATAVGNARA